MNRLVNMIVVAQLTLVLLVAANAELYCQLPFDMKDKELILKYKITQIEEIETKDGITGFSHTTKTFNENGDMVASRLFFAATKSDKPYTDFKYIFTYDKKNQIVEKKYQDNSDHSIIATENYKFDKKGILKEIADNGDNQKTVYKFDKKNKLTAEIRYLKKQIIYSVRYTYNKENQLIGSQGMDAGKAVTGRVEFAYDSLGNMISETGYHPWGEVNYKKLSKYNEKGLKTETSNIQADGKLENTIKFIYK